VPNIPACVPHHGNPASPASLFALSTGRGLEVAQDSCLVQESRQRGVVTSRIPFCSPRAGTKTCMRLPRPDIASDPKPETRISCKASLRRVPSPSPVRGESIIWDGWQWRKIHKTVMSLGGLMQRKKNMEKPKADQCLSARGRDEGQTIRVPSVITRGRLYTPSRRARGRHHPSGAAARRLPNAEAPRRPEASRAWRRRARCQ